VTGALPVVSGAAVVRALKRAGFEQVSQRGSHVKLRHASPRRITVVPLHSELDVGTLKAVLRQADLTAEAFRRLL
jgi:predicted RNA binding protein YcfA (HicA-like mRNA interferase family)